MSISFCSERDVEYFKNLFNIESYLRLVVRWELIGEDPDGWKGSIPDELLREAIKRVGQEEDLKVVDTKKGNLLSYLNLSELKDLMLEPNFWDKYLKQNWGSMDLVAADFKRLIAVRNKLAHFRSITERDGRLVIRFLEDLELRTSAYDLKRNMSRSIGHTENIETKNRFLRSSNVTTFFQNKFSDTEMITEGGCRLFSLGPNWGIAVSIYAGSIDPKYISDLVNSMKITICRIGDSGDQLEVQFSKKLSDRNVEDIFDCIAMAISNPIETTFSSSETSAIYSIPQNDELLNWRNEFPCAFQY